MDCLAIMYVLHRHYVWNKNKIKQCMFRLLTNKESTMRTGKANHLHIILIDYIKRCNFNDLPTHPSPTSDICSKSAHQWSRVPVTRWVFLFLITNEWEQHLVTVKNKAHTDIRLILQFIIKSRTQYYLQKKCMWIAGAHNWGTDLKMGKGYKS